MVLQSLVEVVMPLLQKKIGYSSPEVRTNLNHTSIKKRIFECRIHTDVLIMQIADIKWESAKTFVGKLSP